MTNPHGSADPHSSANTGAATDPAAAASASSAQSPDRLARWRLVLGGNEADGTGAQLGGDFVAMDQALGSLYEAQRGGAGLGSSAPRVSRWLGDIRTYFPRSVVRVMQRDAVDRLGLRQMLLQPELLETVESDLHLVVTLVELGNVIPDETKDTARRVVRRLVDELLERLSAPLEQAVSGALDRASRTRRPRHSDIDWNRTIRANLSHYQPEFRTIVPERLIGYSRSRRQSLKDVVLLIDQSGSMAPSVVYASVFGAVLASLPALTTRLVAFDTAVVDLTDQADDPVDVLFGVQLGGGTDIDRAVGYAQQFVRRPQDTVVVLISDLYEGGNKPSLLARVRTLVASGVTMVALLALSDEGAPWYDHTTAAEFAALGVPAFACTPDVFPELMAAAIDGTDLSRWAGERGIVTARADG